MEAPMLFDMMFGVMVLLGGFILRRIFALTDRLAAEDKRLHERITIVQTEYVSKKDFDKAVDRIIDCINRLEMKMAK
jgi:hypothetical protein|tara:strand:- start:84 stop:314 length:231 start_codon:yes stop_codon:yes gene_type:complete